MYQLDLHSSMDRFEDEILTIIRTQLIIYIPVWIDLKLQEAGHLGGKSSVFTFQYG